VGLGKSFSPWQGIRYTGDIQGEVKTRITTLSWNEDGFVPLHHRLTVLRQVAGQSGDNNR